MEYMYWIALLSVPVYFLLKTIENNGDWYDWLNYVVRYDQSWDLTQFNLFLFIFYGGLIAGVVWLFCYCTSPERIPVNTPVSTKQAKQVSPKHSAASHKSKKAKQLSTKPK